MRVKFLDCMGSDITVVNAARASFDKESEYEFEKPSYAGLVDQVIGAELCWLKESDHRLIHFLARGMQRADWEKYISMLAGLENPETIARAVIAYKQSAVHWAPFSHPQIRLSIETSVAVARQLVKHQIGFAWSEVSRRYVSTLPGFEPIEWRKRAPTVKQGSSDEPGEYPPVTFKTSHGTMSFTYEEVQQALAEAYMLAVDPEDDFKIAPEQARMTLPLAMQTSWTWTGSLYAWSRLLQARLDSHAQKETRDVAQEIYRILVERFPVSIQALTTYDAG